MPNKQSESSRGGTQSREASSMRMDSREGLPGKGEMAGSPSPRHTCPRWKERGSRESLLTSLRSSNKKLNQVIEQHLPKFCKKKKNEPVFPK